jgi:hypothetical protein
MPCSKNNKNKNNKRQKYNCLTNSVSHCRNTKPTPTPTPSPNPIINLPSEKYNIYSTPEKSDSLKTTTFNGFILNFKESRIYSLIFLDFTDITIGYRSMYNFDLKYDIKLHLKLLVEQLQPITTTVSGDFLVGKTATRVLESRPISCSSDVCIDIFNIPKESPYTELNSFLFSKDSIFPIKMDYKFFNTVGGVAGSLKQIGLTPYKDDNIGEIILTPSLPIILPIAENFSTFTLSVNTTTIDLEFESEYCPKMPIDNFIYKVDVDGKTNFTIKEECFAIIKAKVSLAVSGNSINGFYYINYKINNLEVNIEKRELINSVGTEFTFEKLIKLMKDDNLNIYTIIDVTESSLGRTCKQTITGFSFTIV